MEWAIQRSRTVWVQVPSVSPSPGGVVVADASAEPAHVMPERVGVQDPALGQIGAGLDRGGDPFLISFVAKKMELVGDSSGSTSASSARRSPGSRSTAFMPQDPGLGPHQQPPLGRPSRCGNNTANFTAS
ncbi:hypothetical protein [Streptomyces sp. NPDC046942]|uniref:hypothetical protein n=1 Tax=Streptomyces sp. NPDC046942 TaxID=3155137 RepID=UPI003409DEE7